MLTDYLSRPTNTTASTSKLNLITHTHSRHLEMRQRYRHHRESLKMDRMSHMASDETCSEVIELCIRNSKAFPPDSADSTVSSRSLILRHQSLALSAFQTLCCANDLSAQCCLLLLLKDIHSVVLVCWILDERQAVT